MSLSGALTSAVTGLDVQSRALGAISDNVANSQTVGYKRVETQFSTLLTVSNSQVHEPGGVTSRPVRTLDVQGPVQSTGVVTNLALSGEGYFAVSKVNGVNGLLPTFQSDPLYTRAGDFQIDANGYMVNTAGYYLNGWPIDQSTGITQTQQLTQIRINQLKDNPQATQKVTYATNLPATPDSKNDTDNATAGIQFPVSKVLIYDSLGSAHSIDVQWAQDPSSSNNTWTATFSSSDPTMSITAPSGPVRFTFSTQDNLAMDGDGDGTDDTVPGVQAGSITGIDYTDANGNPVSLNLSASRPDLLDLPTDLPITVNFTGPQASSQDISMNFGRFGVAEQTTMFKGTGIEFGTSTQDGLPPGSFRDMQIDAQGIVTINYDNGAQKRVYQVPVAQFSDYNALQPKDGNAYATTKDSGIAGYVQPGSNGTGSIVASSLESSNVDIAAEFTKMIQTQRAYGANSRVITVANQLLQETNDLIR
jgi:flagellar hook protein FlgE